MIKSLGCSRELTEKNGRATGEAALSTHTHAYTRVKINQHTLPASTIPWHILSMLLSRVEPIWFAIDLEDAWLVLRECIPRYDLKPRSLRLTGCVSKFYNLYKYLTRVDNPMTYPADVVIAN